MSTSTAAARIAPDTTAYEIDPSHSAAHFSVRHMMVTNVRGELGKVTGTLLLDTQDITRSSVNASIETATISSRDPKRDEHLRSADFLDVAKFPAITFASTRVAKKGDDLQVTGTLTLHGVSREVVLDVEGPSPELKTPWGGFKRGVTATTKLNRKDYGLAWNATLEAGGMLVGELVSITLELEFDRK